MNSVGCGRTLSEARAGKASRQSAPDGNSKEASAAGTERARREAQDMRKERSGEGRAGGPTGDPQDQL